LQGCVPRGRPGSHITCSRECKECWGHEPSHSQVNSHVGNWSPKRIPEFSKHNYKGQTSSPQRVLYIIGNLLKLRCLKWSRISHLDIWNISYDQKKGRESNWQFDSRPLKVENWPNFLACRQHVTYRWKALDKGYTFALNFIVIKGLHRKLCTFKVVESQLWEFRDTHLGVSGQKAIWMWPSWRAIEYTVRGKVVASPKSGPWWVLCVRIARGSS
jgi:hypothetical protein